MIGLKLNYFIISKQYICMACIMQEEEWTCSEHNIKALDGKAVDSNQDGDTVHPHGVE